MQATRLRHIIAWLLLVILALPLAACGGEDDAAVDVPTSTPASVASPAATPAASATTSATTPSTATASPTSSGPDDLPGPVALAVQAAADDFRVPVEQVELVEWTMTEWNDSSLGCAQPGEFYAQVITPGYIVSVRVAGEERDYHTDTSIRVVTCPQQPVP